MKTPGGLEALLGFGFVLVAISGAAKFIHVYRVPLPAADLIGQLALGGSVVLLALVRRHSFRETFSLRWPGLLPIVAALLAAGAMCVVAVGLAGLVDAVFRALNLDTSDKMRIMEEHIREVTKHGWTAAYIGIGVLPALMEETVFRGFILTGMRKSFGPWRGAIYAGLLFAILHLVLQQIVVVFILGLHFAVLVLLTRSIYASMMAHALNNMFVLTVIRLAGSADPAEIQKAQASMSPIFQGAGAILIGAVGLIFYTAAVFWLVHLRRRMPTDPPILQPA